MEGIDFRQTAREILYDDRGAVNPKRLVILRLLYAKNQSQTPSLSMQELKQILFELPSSSHSGYFKKDEVQNKKSNIENLTLESLILQDNGRFVLDETFPDRFSADFRNRHKHEKISDLVNYVGGEEKQLVFKISDDVFEKIKKDTEEGLEILAKNYTEFLSKLTANEKDELILSIRKKDPKIFSLAKIIGVMPAEMYRLSIDVWGYSFYNILFAIHLKDKLGLNFGIDRKIIQENTEIILKSQNESGSWSVGNYEKSGFDVIDTGIILELLYFIKSEFQEINVPNKTIQDAQDFLRGSLSNFSENMKRSVVEHGFMRQNTLLSTGAACQSIYKTNILLKKPKEQNFHDEDFVATLRYLFSLRRDNGTFSKDADSDPDMESTVLITKMIFGKYNLNLLPRDIKEILGVKVDPLKTIDFVQQRRSIVSEYLMQNHANVFGDTIHALLTVGVWPTCHYMLDGMSQATAKLSQDLQEAKKKKFWDWFSGNSFLPISYSIKATPSIHVIHEALNYLDITDDYRKNPNSYWNRLSELLIYNGSV